MKKRDIQVLADLLKEHKEEDKGKSAILLLGAGASVSAGIPATPKIIEHIKAEPKYQSRIKDILNETYADYMGALTQAHRKELFKKYNEEAKINAAHLYAAQIFNAGFVDCVITTNFDNLFLRAHNLFSLIPPPTYDLSIMREVVTDDIDLPGVIYLHGQTHGMWQLNDERELNKVSPAITRIINKLSSNHTWIIVGYSGNDPIFNNLKNINSFSDELYWVGYKNNPLEPKVQEFLESSHGCYYIDDYDADSFFNELRLKLGETEQSFIHKPFTHLKNLYDEVLPIDKDGQSIDLCQSAKKWMGELIVSFEERKEYTIPSLEEIKSDILLEAIKNIFNDENYEKLTEVEDEIKASNNDEAKKYLSWCYNNYAIELQDVNEDYEKAKYNYEKSLEISPREEKAHYNYANLLIDHFNDRKGAKEHYKKALEINPDYAKAHNNFALLLIEYFTDKKGAKNHYEEALRINPQDASFYYNYANLLAQHFEDKEMAKNYYEKVLKIDPQDADTHNNYGLLLKNQFNDYPKAKIHYQKALEFNPKLAETHTNLAILLKENFDDAKVAQQHYLKAVEIKPSQKTPELDAYFGVDT